MLLFVLEHDALPETLLKVFLFVSCQFAFNHKFRNVHAIHPVGNLNLVSEPQFQHIVLFHGPQFLRHFIYAQDYFIRSLLLASNTFVIVFFYININYFSYCAD